MGINDIAVMAFINGLKSQGITPYECASDTLPDVVIANEVHGILAFVIQTTKSDSDDFRDELKRTISRKLKNLRVEIGDESRQAKIKIQTVFVDTTKFAHDAPQERLQVVIPIKVAPTEELEDPLLGRFIDLVKNRFEPAFVFTARNSAGSDDSSLLKRARDDFRFRLDTNQAAVARDIKSEVTIASGPAGSGKTLVLAARAKLLHENNPSWYISIVCFNNALKPYLQSLVPNSPKIRVETFYEFITRCGDRFSMKATSEHLAEKQFQGLLYNPANCDALLVDEGQDFYAGWLKYLAKKVRPLRGGMLIVGDDNQAIYRKSTMSKHLAALKPVEIFLAKPYRSTKQIIEFVNALMPEAAIDIELVDAEGPVPELNFVLGGVSNKGRAQTEALAVDILRALRTDETLKYSDIGILCTRKFEMMAVVKRLNEILSAELGGANLVSPLFDTKDFNPDLNTIKLLTMHSAKGLEFRYVYLIGLEELAKKIDELPSNFEDNRELLEARLNFIGPTRAKDKLTAYYAKDNMFLRRLMHHPTLFEQRLYPQDYEVPESWQN